MRFWCVCVCIGESSIAAGVSGIAVRVFMTLFFFKLHLHGVRIDAYCSFFCCTR